ncbi:formylglycine-generating enzyme family protein [Nodosilinea sp. LEGE 06152]|uniref:formylglycine-generating enzyme family protein n=1 Tax=Nodosilinea sp. LEGE 06152 TaxID=2777966 RepID=UPI0018823D67|nr:formylglycine-generating enzyme family protein [Nodosilinea sp. LEGE 06152]MBE9160668.1 formylglycine-generating enzyme family protein [Nodosilinea sp. LEGE 06152]
MSDSLSPSGRLALIKLVNALMQPDFEALVFAIKAPPYLIPSNFSAQGNRSPALLQWVESPGGCGLSEFLAVLEGVAPGAFQLTDVSLPTQSTSPASKVQPEKKTKPSFQEHLGGGKSLDMVYIPEGRFWMGSPETKEGRCGDEGPQHKVHVPAFYMGKYPVTQAQWLAVSLLDDVERDLKPHPSRFKGDNLPVERVTWFEAVEFCARLSKHTRCDYRLPSEAEWEYACRAGTTSPYYFGDTISTDQVNHKEHYGKTTEVGRFPPNAFGLYDMHGNVWEWCQDHWHDNYEGAPTDGSAWIEGGNSGYRVRRGGSWDFSPRICRSAYRFTFMPGLGNDSLGFRVVCSAPRTL